MGDRFVVLCAVSSVLGVAFYEGDAICFVCKPAVPGDIFWNTFFSISNLTGNFNSKTCGVQTSFVDGWRFYGAEVISQAPMTVSELT
jgi:hypothetical protein